MRSTSFVTGRWRVIWSANFPRNRQHLIQPLIVWQTREFTLNIQKPFARISFTVEDLPWCWTLLWCHSVIRWEPFYPNIAECFTTLVAFEFDRRPPTLRKLLSSKYGFNLFKADDFAGTFFLIQSRSSFIYFSWIMRINITSASWSFAVVIIGWIFCFKHLLTNHLTFAKALFWRYQSDICSSIVDSRQGFDFRVVELTICFTFSSGSSSATG